MTRGALKSLFFGSILLACSPGPQVPAAPTITYDEDPRLGVLVFDRAAREPLAPQVESIDVVRVEVTSDGLAHVLAGFGPWRAWGETKTQAGDLLYRVVHPDGRVEERPVPPIGTPVLGDLATQGTPDGKLVLVESGTLGAGQLVRVHVFDDTRWHTHELLRNDRAPGTATSGGTVQARAFTPDDVLVQYNGRLHHSDGKGWTVLPNPAGAERVFLGPFAATGARLLWLDARGLLHARMLHRETGQPTGKDAIFAAPGLAFGARWNWSGTPDAFVLDLDAGTNEVQVARFANGGFRDLGRNPASGPVLRSSSDANRATRAVVEQGAVRFVPLFQGAPSGSEVVLPAGANVTCDNGCFDPEEALSDGTPRRVSRSGDCLRCVPRALSFWALDLDHSGRTIHALYSDVIQEGRRLYLKKLAWPQLADPYADPPVTDTAYPGEPAVVPEEPTPPEPALLTARLLRVGRTDHSAISATLRGTDANNGHVVVNPVVPPDGNVVFDPVPTGAYVLEANDGTYAVTLELTLVAGPRDLGGLVLEASSLPTEVPATATLSSAGRSGEYVARSGANLWYLGSTSAHLLSSNVTAGPRLFGMEDVVVWESGDNVEGAVGTSTSLLGGFVGLGEVHPMGFGFVVPQEGYAGIDRLFGWFDAYARRTTYYRNAVDASGNGWCSGTWIWAKGLSTTGFDLTWQASCDRPQFSTPTALVGTSVPRLFDHAHGAFQSRAMAATEEEGCGATGGYFRTCTLWGLGDSTETTRRLSTQAIAYDVGWNEVFWMDRAADGTLSVRARSLDASAAALASGAALDVIRKRGESWLVAGGTSHTGSQRAWWRQSDGLWSANTVGGDRRNVAKFMDSVVRLRESPYDDTPLAFRQAVVERANSGSDCANGCTTARFRLDLAQVTEGIAVNATEAYQVLPFDRWAVDGDTWNDCPGGPCRVVSVVSPGGGRVPLARGTLAVDRDGPLVRGGQHLALRRDGVLHVVHAP